MISIERCIKKGESLLEDYHRINDEIINQRFTEHDNARTISAHYINLVGDLNHFKKGANKFITDTEEYADSHAIHSESREHEYVNDFEVDSQSMRDFYSYGIAIEHIMQELKLQTSGSPESSRKRDGKIRYAVKEKIIYRNDEIMPVKSREHRRESFCKIVFRARGRWVTATEIEEERAKRCGGNQHEKKEPYDWVRKVCLELNGATKDKFKIDYNLFETEDQQIRLNPKAK